MLWRWRGEPRGIRWVAGVLVWVLVYGTLVHVAQLALARLAPYPGIPAPLRAYFVALTGLDPIAAALLAARRRSGVVLAVAVLVSDAVANAWVNYVLDDARGVTLGRIGSAVVSALALASVLLAPRLWTASSPRGDSAAPGPFGPRGPERSKP